MECTESGSHYGTQNKDTERTGDTELHGARARPREGQDEKPKLSNTITVPRDYLKRQRQVSSGTQLGPCQAAVPQSFSSPRTRASYSLPRPWQLVTLQTLQSPELARTENGCRAVRRPSVYPNSFQATITSATYLHYGNTVRVTVKRPLAPIGLTPAVQKSQGCVTRENGHTAISTPGFWRG